MNTHSTTSNEGWQDIATAPEVVRDLHEALKWALPLAERALEDHRSERLRCGHNDIKGTDARGNVVLGLWQTEVDQRDNARAALRKVEQVQP